MADAQVVIAAALKERYTVERELGRGGMATVYLAQDRKHDREVAIKVLHPGIAVSRRVIQSHEGAISAVNHPDGGAVFRLAIPGAGSGVR